MLLPVLAVVALVGALAERTIRSLSAPPKIEPRFEHVSGQRPGPVREFALRDIHGAVYTREEWRGRPAIVLFFVTDQGLNWFDQRPEIERLIRKFSPRGCYFACIVADNGEKHASNAELFMADPALKLPVLLDREHQIAHQAGIRATPEFVVLNADGQIFYRGRIGEHDGVVTRARSRTWQNRLESALEAILAGEMPIAALTQPVDGQSAVDEDLIADSRQAEEITFARHVAPIVYNNCARCHRPGQVAPFSLLTYKDAVKRGA